MGSLADGVRTENLGGSFHRVAEIPPRLGILVAFLPRPMTLS